MKHKKFLLIALICLIGIGISFLLFSAHKMCTRDSNTLQRMVDREAKRAEGKGVGYDRWASLHNLKQMAATHNFIMENGLLDLDKLDARCV